MYINQKCSFSNNIRAFFLLIRKLFLLIPLGIGLYVLDSKLAQVPNSYTVKYNFMKNKASQIELLILGDSGAFYGVNPLQITCYFGFNFAQNTQTIIVNSKLLLKFYKELKNLKAVLFVLDTATFEFGIAPRDLMLRRYYGIAQFESRWRDFISNSSFLSLGLYLRRAILINKFTNPYLSELSPEGWLHNEPGVETTAEIMQKKQHLFRKKVFEDNKIFRKLEGFGEHDIRKANFDWLNKALDKLDENTKVYFIIPPVVPSYFAYQDASTYEYANSLLRQIEAQRKNVRFLHTPPDSLFNDMDFNDPEHLSRTGALKFSEFLNSKLCKSNDIN